MYKLDQALILAALIFVSSNVYGTPSYGDAENNSGRISAARGTGGRNDQSGNHFQNRNNQEYSQTSTYRADSSNNLIRGERSPDVEEWESKPERAIRKAQREQGDRYKNPQETFEQLMWCVRNNSLNEIERVLFDIFKRSDLVNFVTTIKKHGNKINDREIQAHLSNTFKNISLFINMQNEKGMTLLHEAVQGDKVDIVKYLIDHGADVNKKDNFGRTPLRCVNFWNRNHAPDIIRVLLENRADPNTKDSEGETPLAKVCEMGDEESAKLLVEYGANVNEENGRGATPFHYSIWAMAGDRCSASLAKFLIDKGADINAKTKDGQTMLIFAVESKRLDIVKLLIDLKADVNVKGIAQNLTSKKERTPLEIAKYYSDFREGYLEIIELLQKHGVKP